MSDASERSSSNCSVLDTVNAEPRTEKNVSRAESQVSVKFSGFRPWSTHGNQ